MFLRLRCVYYCISIIFHVCNIIRKHTLYMNAVKKFNCILKIQENHQAVILLLKIIIICIIIKKSHTSITVRYMYTWCTSLIDQSGKKNTHTKGDILYIQNKQKNVSQNTPQMRNRRQKKYKNSAFLVHKCVFEGEGGFVLSRNIQNIYIYTCIYFVEMCYALFGSMFLKSTYISRQNV